MRGLLGQMGCLGRGGDGSGWLKRVRGLSGAAWSMSARMLYYKDSGYNRGWLPPGMTDGTEVMGWDGMGRDGRGGAARKAWPKAPLSHVACSARESGSSGIQQPSANVFTLTCAAATMCHKGLQSLSPSPKK